MGLKKKVQKLALACALSVPLSLISSNSYADPSDEVIEFEPYKTRVITPNRDFRNFDYLDYYRKPRLELPKNMVDFDITINYSRRAGNLEMVEQVNGLIEIATNEGYLGIDDVLGTLSEIQESIDDSQEIYTYISQKAGTQFSLFLPSDTLMRVEVGMDLNTQAYVNMPSEEVVDLDDAPIGPYGIYISEDNYFRDIGYLLKFGAFYLRDESPSQKVFDFFSITDVFVNYGITQQFKFKDGVNIGVNLDMGIRHRDYWGQEFSVPELTSFDDALNISLDPLVYVGGPIFNLSIGSFLYLPNMYSRPAFSINAYDLVSTPLENKERKITVLQDPLVVELGAHFSPIDIDKGGLDSLTLGLFVSAPFFQEKVNEQYRLHGTFEYEPGFIYLNGSLTKTNQLQRATLGVGTDITTPIGLHVKGGIQIQKEEVSFPFTSSVIEIGSIMGTVEFGWDSYQLRKEGLLPKKKLKRKKEKAPKIKF